MDQNYLSCQTVQGSYVMIGGDFGQAGHETPDSRMILNLKVTPCNPGGGEPTGPMFDLSVGITIQQMAFIVITFFDGLIFWPKKNIWKSFLVRLLEKRWAVMTDSMAKDQYGWNADWHEAMRYPKVGGPQLPEA